MNVSVYLDTIFSQGNTEGKETKQKQTCMIGTIYCSVKISLKTSKLVAQREGK